MQIISRAEAKVAGVKRYFTGKPCSKGHIAERFVTSYACIICARNHVNAAYKKDPRKQLARNKRTWANRDVEQTKVKIRAYYHRTKDARREQLKAQWKRQYRRNPGAQRENTSRWLKNNPQAADRLRECRRAWWREKGGHYVRLRQAAKIQRTPSWADENRIRIVYATAAQMRRDLGIALDVDHVIPLRGRIVSGLHVHNNLKIVPAKENRSKGNRFYGLD